MTINLDLIAGLFFFRINILAMNVLKELGSFEQTDERGKRSAS